MLKFVRSSFGFIVFILLMSSIVNSAHALDGISTSIPTTSASINQSPSNASISTNVTSTSGTVSTIGTPSVISPTTISTDASTTVDGVRVFGNGTIITSVNGTSMSFFFDPNKPSSPTASLTVVSDDMS